MADLTQQDSFNAVMDLSDDGFLLLAADGTITYANQEAARIFGVTPDDLTGKGAKTGPRQEAWQQLFDACAKGQRADLGLTTASGRRVLASLRRKPHADHIEMVSFCDLERFDYRRDVATGRGNTASTGHMGSNRTRPDFGMQRRLCPTLNKVLSRGERAMQQGARILITGESGVGKSEIARFLHSGVARASEPFVTINCAMTGAEDLGKVLFGSGDAKDSAFFRAAGGTLFLDEVAEIPLSVQARLVGFLEDSVIGNSRSQSSIPMGPRLIVATNRNLQELVREGKFRADLFYRLAVVRIDVPPLRQMQALIRHLTDRFLLTINRRRTQPVVFPDDFRRILEDYSFPGNIRELLNIVQRGAIFIEDAADMSELMAELLTSGPVLPDTDLPEVATLDLKTEVRRFERALIDKAIQAHGSKRKAAKALGIDIGTISRKTAEPSNT